MSSELAPQELPATGAAEADAAGMLGNLRHLHLVQVLAVGETDGGSPYMALASLLHFGVVGCEGSTEDSASTASTTDDAATLAFGEPCELEGVGRKLAARASGARPDPFLDPDGCHEYAAESAARLRQRIADEG